MKHHMFLFGPTSTLYMLEVLAIATLQMEFRKSLFPCDLTSAPYTELLQALRYHKTSSTRASFAIENLNKTLEHA